MRLITLGVLMKTFKAERLQARVRSLLVTASLGLDDVAPLDPDLRSEVTDNSKEAFRALAPTTCSACQLRPILLASTVTGWRH